MIRPNTECGNAADIFEMWKQAHSPKLAKRLNAIRLLMSGYGWQEVAEISGMSRQTVHDWVGKWNRNGKEGLENKSGGSQSKVTDKMRADITKVVDVKIHTNRGIVTGKLIHGYLKKVWFRN
ncbi:MAG: helix-turn-helix domain-containing protein [Candidatus Humimicrobiaceae bacterium]